MDSSKKIRAVLIGCGNQMIQEIVPGILDCDYKYEIIGACDTNPESLQKFKNSISLTSDPDNFFFDDVTQMLKMKKPSLAIIAVPHNHHFQLTTLCLKNGVNVIKEKPLAINLEEAKEVLELVKKTKKTVTTITKRRYYDSMRVLKSYIETTTPYSYNFIRYIAKGTQLKGWRGKKDASGGGVVLDLGYHLLNSSIHLFGEILRVYAYYGQSRLKYGVYDTEDYACLLVRHKNGVYGTFHFAAMTGYKTERLSVLAPDAFIQLDDDQITLKRFDKELTEISIIQGDYSQVGNVYSRVFQEIDIFNLKQSLKNIDEQISTLRVIKSIYG